MRMAKTNTMTIITGKSGCGKSYFSGYLVEQGNPQRVILDPEDDFLGLAQANLLITEQVYEAVQKQYGGDWTPFFLAAIQQHPSLRVSLDGITIDQGRELADGLANAVHKVGNRLFVADEYWRFAPNGRVPPGIQKLHTDARKHGIDIIAATQRAALTDTTVMSQANVHITFQLTDVNDVKRIAPYFGPVDGTPADKFIPTLQPRQCLIRDSKTGEQEFLDTNGIPRSVAHVN